MKKIIFILMFLVAVSLVEAATLNLDKTELARGDILTIAITCTGDSTLRFFNPGQELILVDQGQNTWQSTYNTKSDSNRGKYKLSLSCQDGTSVEKFFCVNAVGCLGTTTATTTTPATTSSSSSSGGYGAGPSCTSQWDCAVWSSCNATLKQKRTCSDKNSCNPTKTEYRDCAQCEESWSCQAWSACSNGYQSHNCFDDNKCGTTFKKPLLRRACEMEKAAPAPQPRYYEPPVEEEEEPAPAPQPKPKEKQIEQPASFWEENKIYLLGGGSAVLLSIIGGIVYYLYSKKKEESEDNTSLTE